MFKYLFNGKLFQANTIEELNKMLSEAGYKGDVIEEFNAILKDESLPNPEDVYNDEFFEQPVDDDAINQPVDDESIQQQPDEIDLITDQLEEQDSSDKDA